MGEVIKFERIKEGKSTLAEIYEEITEGYHPFVTFRVTHGGNIMIHTGIENCHISTYKANPEIVEIKNCSSDEEYRTQVRSIYMSKDQMKNYILIKKAGVELYVFEHRIL